MAPQYPVALRVTERVLKVLTGLNLLYGAGILLLLIASLVKRDLLLAALTGRPPADARGAFGGMRPMMVVGIAAIPIAHLLLGRLRGERVETVGIALHLDRQRHHVANGEHVHGAVGHDLDPAVARRCGLGMRSLVARHQPRGHGDAGGRDHHGEHRRDASREGTALPRKVLAQCHLVDHPRRRSSDPALPTVGQSRRGVVSG